MLSRSSARSAPSSGVVCLSSRETQLAGDEHCAFSGDGRRAQIVELVIQRSAGLAMVSGLRGLDRLIAQRGQDEAVCLVKKGLMRGSIAMKHLRHCGRCGVLKTGQTKQTENKTKHEKTIACPG